MARKPRADKGKKRKPHVKSTPKTQMKAKTKRGRKAVVENKQEEAKMPKQKLDSQEFPMLAKFVSEGYADEAIKFLEALKAGMVVTAAEEVEETDEEEAEEKPKAKKVVEEDDSDEDDDSDDDEDEDDEDEEEVKKQKESEDEDEDDEESEDSDEDEIEVDLDKVDSMDKEKLVELAEKIGIKKAEKMKEKELRAEIIKKVNELQGTATEETEDDEDEDEDEAEEKPAAKKWAVGDKVLAHYAGDSKYYKATIVKVLSGGKYEVKWKDGDTKHTTSSDVKERKQVK